MWELGLAGVTLLCAVQAIRGRHLFSATLGLAATSAGVSILLFALGAHEAAVIELSVGAGLVTVLFVFAINLAGEEGRGRPALVPKAVAGLLVAGSLALLSVLLFASARRPGPAPVQQASFSETLWQQRGLDVLVQVGLLFAGTLGVLGLLSDSPPRAADRQAGTALTPEPSWLSAGLKWRHALDLEAPGRTRVPLHDIDRASTPEHRA